MMHGLNFAKEFHKYSQIYYIRKFRFKRAALKLYTQTLHFHNSNIVLTTLLERWKQYTRKCKMKKIPFCSGLGEVFHRIRVHVPHMITYSVRKIHTSFRLIVQDEWKEEYSNEKNSRMMALRMTISAHGTWAQQQNNQKLRHCVSFAPSPSSSTIKNQSRKIMKMKHDRSCFKRFHETMGDSFWARVRRWGVTSFAKHVSHFAFRWKKIPKKRNVKLDCAKFTACQARWKEKFILESFILFKTCHAHFHRFEWKKKTSILKERTP